MKHIIAFVLVFGCIFLSFSCAGEDQVSYATVTVYNQSDFEVTELHVHEGSTFPLLKQGEEQKFDLEWAPGSPFHFFVSYYANEKFFSPENMEGALYTVKGGHYYSPFRIKDGAKAFVYIGNEGYRVEIDGGDYWVVPENPGSPN
jgi:hypothetical protein